jgi:hypothetical protein
MRIRMYMHTHSHTVYSIGLILNFYIIHDRRTRILILRAKSQVGLFRVRLVQSGVHGEQWGRL